MPTYRTPGVTIEEIPSFPPSVAEVETAIPAFLGYTKNTNDAEGNNLLNVPKLIKSFDEYEALYGTGDSVDVDVTLIKVATDAYRVKSLQVRAEPNHLLYYCMRWFYSNGGGRCYVVACNPAGNPSQTDFTDGLDAIAKVDEPTLLVMPDATKIAAFTNYYPVINAALAQCQELKDRFAIIDVYEHSVDEIAKLRNTLSASADFRRYGAAYYPQMKTTIPYLIEHSRVTITNMENEDGSNVGTDALKTKAISDTEIKDQQNQLYNDILLKLDELSITLPPSAGVAGVYCRVDRIRGVHKAPGNENLLDVIEPVKLINDADQAELNIHADAGKSINAIRFFTGKGTKIWGARTLDGNSNEWRYINVRRFYNMVEESIKKAISPFVFEPNDKSTWVMVKAMIENYLTLKYADGALQGATPDEAFFVKVGLGTTMTYQDVLEGRMNVEIGLAVVRPAEFIILKFSHIMLGG